MIFPFSVTCATDSSLLVQWKTAVSMMISGVILTVSVSLVPCFREILSLFRDIDSMAISFISTGISAVMDLLMSETAVIVTLPAFIPVIMPSLSTEAMVSSVDI